MRLCGSFWIYFVLNYIILTEDANMKLCESMAITHTIHFSLFCSVFPGFNPKSPIKQTRTACQFERIRKRILKEFCLDWLRATKTPNQWHGTWLILQPSVGKPNTGKYPCFSSLGWRCRRTQQPYPNSQRQLQSSSLSLPHIGFWGSFRGRWSPAHLCVDAGVVAQHVYRGESCGFWFLGLGTTLRWSSTAKVNSSLNSDVKVGKKSIHVLVSFMFNGLFYLPCFIIFWFILLLWTIIAWSYQTLVGLLLFICTESGPTQLTNVNTLDLDLPRATMDLP
jgi:hypothetical protein